MHVILKTNHTDVYQIYCFTGNIEEKNRNNTGSLITITRKLAQMYDSDVQMHRNTSERSAWSFGALYLFILLSFVLVTQSYILYGQNNLLMAMREDWRKAETFITSYSRAIVCQCCSHYQVFFHNIEKEFKMLPSLSPTKNTDISINHTISIYSTRSLQECFCWRLNLFW